MKDSYNVVILPVVIRKDLKKIPKSDIQRIMDKIKSLAVNPRPAWAFKLSSREEYRGRQGVYRTLYVIDDGIKVVQVTEVRYRKDVYQ